jgi:lysophospholipase L1-like esterase
MFSKCLSLSLLLFAVDYSAADPPPVLKDAKRIVFLGDSNTYAGHYVVVVEAHLKMQLGNATPEIINLGLGSETCNGMTEPGHPFPRPNVQERIDRVLAKLKPDVVVACYGMNDGIYHPPTEKHFAAYRDGINQIIQKVDASGAKLILMTPPAFDPIPLRKKGKLLPLGASDYSWKTVYEDYDDVMKQFAGFVKEQSSRVAKVVDLHQEVSDYMKEKRASDPHFSMSPDGVHVNQQGHEAIGKAVLKSLGLEPQDEADRELLKLIGQRQKLMRDAWLSEVGHLRPGIKPGLPIAEAEKKAAKLDEQIAGVLTVVAK